MIEAQGTDFLHHPENMFTSERSTQENDGRRIVLNFPNSAVEARLVMDGGLLPAPDVTLIERIVSVRRCLLYSGLNLKPSRLPILPLTRWLRNASDDHLSYEDRLLREGRQKELKSCL